jgi:hypothetical protein
MSRHTILIAIFIQLSVISGCTGKTSYAPILLLATETEFGTYTAEILKTEGFNEFELDSLNSGNATPSYLAKFDLVILAESKISPGGINLIREYVKQGGNLIAFRPHQDLAELFGIVPKNGNFTQGYICIDTTTQPGKGLTSKELQFHETADKYALQGGKSIATFFTCKNTKEGFPAVVNNIFEKGHTVAFLYNLPKNIVYTRQGNPLFAGIEKDSIPGLRGMDLFTDGWVDTANNTLNQADEQMILLSHCIEMMYPNTKPLPRFWYFPDTLKCLVTLTNDGEYKSEADFEIQFREVDSMGAKMSIYILEVDKVSKAWVEKWIAKGFEISGHPDATKEAGNPKWNTMDSALTGKKNEITAKYGLEMRTNVNHWFVWCGTLADGTRDFGAQARLEEKNGIEMDINYAHYDMNSNQGDFYLGTPGYNQGNFTGSGLVMRYADAQGKTTRVYQHFNSVYDQQYMENKDPEGFYNCFKGLMDRSLHNEVYSFISVKSHNDEYYFSRNPLLKMLNYANQNKIPVWTELQLLDFIKMKDQAGFSDVKWSKNRLTFILSSACKHSGGLSFYVPANHGMLKIRHITLNDQDMPFKKVIIKGYDYALLTVNAGNTYDISVKYQ